VGGTGRRHAKRKIRLRHRKTRQPTEQEGHDKRWRCGRRGAREEVEPWWITGGSIMREAHNRSQQMHLLSLSLLSEGGGQQPLSSAAAAATAVAVS